jgi:hypothetical protein
VLRVSFPNDAGYVLNWPAFCAKRLGYYAVEGLDVELIAMPSEQAQSDALLSGEIPFARRGPDPHLHLIDAGAPVAILASLLCRAPLFLYAQPQIGWLGDLRGTTVGGVASAGGTFPLRLVLADRGVAPADYAIAPVGKAKARFEALRAGKVAAALRSPPVSAQAAAAGFRCLLRLPERYPAFMYSTFQANTGVSATMRAAVAGLLRADRRSRAWLNDPAHRSGALRILAAEAGVDERDAEICYRELVERDSVFCDAPGFDRAGFDLVVDALARFTERRPARPADAYVDLSYG